MHRLLSPHRNSLQKLPRGDRQRYGELSSFAWTLTKLRNPAARFDDRIHAMHHLPLRHPRQDMLPLLMHKLLVAAAASLAAAAAAWLAPHNLGNHIAEALAAAVAAAASAEAAAEAAAEAEAAADAAPAAATPVAARPIAVTPRGAQSLAPRSPNQD